MSQLRTFPSNPLRSSACFRWMTTLMWCWSFAYPAFGQSIDWRETPPYTTLDDARAARAAGQPIYRLDLTKQRLRVLPDDITEWSEVREVILDRNKLRVIDTDLSRWTELVVFSAESNELEAFPTSLLRWRNLEQLRLGDNQIDSIPLNIDRLQHLKELSLWSNVISHYPASLGDLKTLELLDLQYNDMTAEEQDLLQSWLPERVRVNLSPPCRCEFDE